MSRMSDAYDAYLAKWKENHKDMVEPTLVPVSELPRFTWDERYRGKTPDGNARMISGISKYWSTGAGGEVLLLDDGRVADFGFTQSGFPRDEAAVWPNVKAYYAWSRPMSLNMYLNG